MRRWIVLVALLDGCDVVWSIDHVPDAPDGPLCALDDEDCDQRGNTIDGCPADPDSPADDTDGDGVGNACDPDRSTAGDHIVFFEPFLDNSRGWVIANGMWRLENSAFTHTVTGDGRVSLTVPPTGVSPSVSAVFDQVNVLDGGAVGIFGALGSSELRCQVFTRSGQETLHMEGFFIVGDVALSGTGPVHVSGGQLRDGRFRCRARHGIDPEVQATSPATMPVQFDRLGLITSNAAVSYTSVMLLDVP